MAVALARKPLCSPPFFASSLSAGKFSKISSGLCCRISLKPVVKEAHIFALFARVEPILVAAAPVVDEFRAFVDVAVKIIFHPQAQTVRTISLVGL